MLTAGAGAGQGAVPQVATGPGPTDEWERFQRPGCRRHLGGVADQDAQADRRSLALFAAPVLTRPRSSLEHLGFHLHPLEEGDEAVIVVSATQEGDDRRPGLERP